MAISKIQYKSSSNATPTVWIDATSATAVASDITSPKTAMLANGVMTTGTGTGSGSCHMPNGGTTGQILTKSSSTDYDVEWANQASEIAIQTSQPSTNTNKIWIDTDANGTVQVPTVSEMNTALAGKVDDVQINSSSVVSNGVANIPIADSSTLGIVKIDTTKGISNNSSTGILSVNGASSANVKSGSDAYKPIVPLRQHEATFYGLAKASGDTSQASSENAVGTYTASAQTAIRSMLGVVGNSDYATTSTAGIIKYGSGLILNGNSQLIVDFSSSAAVKTGTSTTTSLSPARAHEATFYGLAKAAGDTSQASSSNAVGTYTSDALAAIHTMLGIDSAAIAAQVDIPLVETVTGTTPSITGQPNVRYMCGEVTTISITPPANGSIDVIFTSGSTAATLTLPNTVKFPEWFDATALTANTIYELLITDATYGSVMTWAT